MRHALVLVENSDGDIYEGICGPTIFDIADKIVNMFGYERSFQILHIFHTCEELDAALFAIENEVQEAQEESINVLDYDCRQDYHEQ